jgi:hypothetical protein
VAENGKEIADQKDKTRLAPPNLGASTDSTFVTEGSRNLENTPENFPQLDLEANRFFHNLADVALMLEERMSTRFALRARQPGDSEQPYTPASVRTLVDAIESLAYLPKDLNGEFGDDSKESPHRTRYAVGEVTVTQTQNPDDVMWRKLTMGLRPRGLDRGGCPTGIKMVIQPLFDSGVRDRNGHDYPGLARESRDEIIKQLSLCRKSPERIALILSGYWEVRPEVVVSSERAALKMSFDEGKRTVGCCLTVREGQFTPREEWVSEKGIGKSEETIADTVGTRVWEFKMTVPLSRFGRSPVKWGVVDWLQKVVGEIAAVKINRVAKK